MVNEKPSKSNHFLKTYNSYKNVKIDNKKTTEFKSFSERKIKISSKSKQR